MLLTSDTHDKSAVMAALLCGPISTGCAEVINSFR